MNTVQEIKAAIQKLSPRDLAQLEEWIEDFLEDQLELREEVKAKLDQSRAEIQRGLEELDRGEGIPGDEVEAELKAMTRTFRARSKQ